ncbi:FAD-dependent oxidoreductase [Cellulomonas composti]|uniref:CoA-disulfide reductase n=1 Tax=Cellulomonas composti TaxID=266130 RepID=A0A511J763_9CELL|nr:FAD-dependent oxidoreductase [Cellulomonas composti]GEL93852.1 CoA-disulfide reductase [Cellulomonas composti]
MDIVIVGGVAGGMSAATRLRRLDENAGITVVERGEHVSFANCGLPYHLSGVIPERDSLLLQTPQGLAARFGIEVLVRHEARSIDTAGHKLEIVDLTTGESRVVGYDALVLSPGARAVVPPVPGAERALTLRDVHDLDVLGEQVARARTAVVIGGGFVGLEVAENLLAAGLQVAIVEAAPQVMTPIDVEMVAPVHRRLREHGIDLSLGTTVAEITADAVVTSDGRSLPADLVVAAIGVRPDVDLAREAGLRIGARGGIVVDETLRTSAPDVWAVGDAVEKLDALDGAATLVPLANTANLQGRLVADAIVGRPTAQRPVRGTAIVSVLGLQVGSTGWNERRLRAAGKPYRAIHTHPSSHAGYYPGAASMSLKLLVDPTNDEILGAQAVGEDGVDKRIDVVATAMAGGLTASDLADLELAYAPQFGSAKDPVNMLGWVDRAADEGLVATVQWHELADVLAAGATLVDVRTPDEHTRARIPGSVLLPLDELRSRLDELPAGPLVVHCAVGMRGYLAARVLAQHGRDVRNLDGGYRTWLDGTRTDDSTDDSTHRRTAS